jgi:hypothetical protein
LITRDTVIFETRARSATRPIVTRAVFSIAPVIG